MADEQAIADMGDGPLILKMGGKTYPLTRLLIDDLGVVQDHFRSRALARLNDAGRGAPMLEQSRGIAMAELCKHVPTWAECVEDRDCCLKLLALSMGRVDPKYTLAWCKENIIAEDLPTFMQVMYLITGMGGTSEENPTTTGVSSSETTPNDGTT